LFAPLSDLCDRGKGLQPRNEPADEAHGDGEGVDCSFGGSSPFWLVVVLLEMLRDSIAVGRKVRVDPSLGWHRYDFRAAANAMGDGREAIFQLER
jgi:hypothetical protein